MNFRNTLNRLDAITESSDSLIVDIHREFPMDSIDEIRSWMASAKEYGQPLTVDEYKSWRTFNDQGISEVNDEMSFDFGGSTGEGELHEESDMRQLINIIEGEDSLTANDEQIAAIGQLIADRTEQEDSPSKLSTEAFVKLVNRMGIPITKELLMDLAEQGKLESVIKDVNADDVTFKGQRDIDSTKMTVDKARDVISKMATRAAKKGIKK